jgi:hypothetical protein
MGEMGKTAPSILLLTRARNSLHFREPLLTVHLPTPKRLRAGRLVLQGRDSFEAQRTLREDTFSGESAEGPVKCAGERPILQKPQGLVIELPEALWTSDWPRELPGTNQKGFHLCDLSDSAVKAIYFVLPLIIHFLRIFVKMDNEKSMWRD